MSNSNLAPDWLATLHAGAARHTAGQLDQAEAAYRKVLKRVPNQPDALHLLGVVAHERGRPARAIQLINQALRVKPQFPEALTNLARVQRAMGDRQGALASARRAVELAPRLPEAQIQLGRSLLDAPDYQAAAAACEAAIALAPRSLDAWVNLGAAWTHLEEWEKAAHAYRVAHELKPDRAETLIDFARALTELRLYEDALRCHERAITLAPDDPRAHAGHAVTLKRAQDVEGAMAACRRALALAPERADLFILLGNCLSALGRFTAAADAHRQALVLDPDSVEARKGLVAAGQLSADEAETQQLLAVASDIGQPASQRIPAGFALGRLFDKAGDYDAAFAAYATANRLTKEMQAADGSAFDPATLQREIDAVIAGFSARSIAAASTAGEDSDLPVFIVGMPRSGTTLAEQILASHKAVFGAGERPEINQIGGRLIQGVTGINPETWPAAVIREEARRHLAFLRRMAPGALRVIDKLPDNIFWVGVIAVLFPGARIILCRRDLRDVCLSCFFQNFASGMNWTYDLADLAFRARQVERLAAHWRAVLPTSMLLEVQYESLVADLEGQSRRLVSFLGLEWDPACLDFHMTERQVLTASQWQVRQPLYATSAGRWRHYRRHLAGLFEGLAGLIPDGPSAVDAGVADRLSE